MPVCRMQENNEAVNSENEEHDSSSVFPHVKTSAV